MAYLSELLRYVATVRVHVFMFWQWYTHYTPDQNDSFYVLGTEPTYK